MVPSTPTTTLRTSRRRASTAPVEILRATEAVLLEVGEERLSIRRVSERCGYSAPTIYHHFGDKKGLIASLLEERFRVVYQLMRDIPRHQDADMIVVAGTLLGLLCIGAVVVVVESIDPRVVGARSIIAIPLTCGSVAATHC